MTDGSASQSKRAVVRAVVNGLEVSIDALPEGLRRLIASGAAGESSASISAEQRIVDGVHSMRIRTNDADGNVREYDSLDALPPEIRALLGRSLADAAGTPPSRSRSPAARLAAAPRIRVIEPDGTVAPARGSTAWRAVLLFAAGALVGGLLVVAWLRSRG